MKLFLSILILAGLILCAGPAAAATPGSTTDIVFRCTDSFTSSSCNAEGASVYINDEYRGTVSSGEFTIPYQEGFTLYKLTRDGYYDKSGSIEEPAPGQTGDIVIDATLTEKPTGSGKGWLRVNANVNGGTVFFNGQAQGTMSGTTQSFEVSMTGTPYTIFSVSRDGYQTYSGAINRMPSDGETIDLYATLNPVTTTVPTTATTLIGGDQGWFLVTCNADGASVYFDSAYKGTIANGQLSVPIYSTGTPYTNYRVEKSGYVTATGTMPAAPAKGQTVTIPVSLSPVVTTVPATAEPAGSGKGYLAFHTNVDGATVTIGSFMAGVTKSDGLLTVPVSPTGTPFSEFTIAKTGYTTATGTVPRQPATGETVDIFVTLNPEQPTPVPTAQSPLPPAVVVLAILGASLIAVARRT